MSRIDELIKEKCSSGVNYRTLEQLEDSGIITLGRGKVISKKDVQDNPGEYPIYSSSAVGSGIFGAYGDYMFDDVRLSWSIDGGGKFFYRDAPRYSVTNVCGWLTVDKPEVLNIRYLYFALTNEWSKKVFDYVHKAHPSVIRKEYTIPVPPLEVQQEIVRMLDSFTELEAELEAELVKRKQQYEYYRDYLFSFNKDIVPWLPIGEVLVSLNTGLNPRRFFRLNTEDANNYYVTIREIKGGNLCFSDKTDRINDDALRLCNNRSNLEIGDILFSGTGTIGETYEIKSRPYNWNIKEGVYSLKPIKERINPTYLSFILRTEFIKKAYLKKAAGGTVKSVPMAELKKIKIPVPLLPEQERIVSVLESFDALTADLSIGLPAEIETRHKQYEYYRDKLLTFKEIKR